MTEQPKTTSSSDKQEARLLPSGVGGGLIVTALFVLLIGLLSWKAVIEIEKQTQADIGNSLSAVLNTTHQSMQIWVHDRQDDARHFLVRPDFHALIKEQLLLKRSKDILSGSPQLREMREILKPYLEEHRDLGFFVISPGFINIASMRDENLGMANLLSKHGDYLKNIFAGEPQLVLPLRSDVALPDKTGKMAQGEPTMFIGAPVFDGGEVVAAFTIRIDPSLQFTRIAQIARTGKTGESYAFDKNGTLITESRFDDQLQKIGLIKPNERAILSIRLLDPGINLLESPAPKQDRDTLPLTKMAKSATAGERGQDVIGYRDYRGVPVVGAWLWDDELNFGLAFEIDVAEAYRSFYTIRKIVISLLGVTAVLFLGLSIGMVRRQLQTAALADGLKASEESLATAQKIAHIGNWDWDIAANTISWSDEAYRVFGETKQSFNATYEAFLERVHPDDRDMVSDAVEKALKGEKYSIDHRIILANGTERIIHEQGEVIFNNKGKPLQMIGILQDITERKQAERKLKLAGKVLENAIEGIMVTNEKSTIQSVNPTFTEITGYSAEEVIGKKPSILRSDKHDKKFYKDMWDVLIKTGQWSGEIWNRRKGGEAYPERLTITAIKDSDGTTTQYAAVFYDITELKQSEKEIEYKAYHDALTGLPNRQLFYDRLKQTIKLAKRNNSMFAILFIDLDNFKNVNDSLGHLTGDLLLQGVAVRLVASARDGDTVSRLGGDEFTIILDNITRAEEAATVSQRVIDALSESFIYKREKLFTTVSIGIAVYPDNGGNVDDLIKNADITMYHVKDKGKNNYHFFTESLNEKAVRRMALEISLRKAMDNNEMIAYYQPKVDIISEKIVGMEALIRWQKPDGTIVSPGLFIPVAEEIGIVAEMDRLMLEKSCKFIQRIKEASGSGASDLAVVSINLSAVDFENKNLHRNLADAVMWHGLEPHDIEFEVTESMIITNVEAVIRTLGALREVGFSIAIDDFGTGYSSLSYLAKFPIDTLKIDRAFVVDLPQDKKAQSIAKAIAFMAHELNIKVVAEGVETMAQLEFMRSIGCEQVQGYIYSKPLPENEIEKLLMDGKSLVPKDASGKH